MKVYTKSEVDAAVEVIRRETAARMENFVGVEVQTITIDSLVGLFTPRSKPRHGTMHDKVVDASK